MSIAQRLSWELVAMNERDASETERTAVEICYGVALAISDPGAFSITMSRIVGQVSDKTLAHYLKFYRGRGLAK